MALMQKLSDIFWAEWFWLPPEHSWKDVREWEHYDRYPNWKMPFQEPLLVALVFIVVRKILETICFRRVVIWLGISGAQQKRAPRNRELEKHFAEESRRPSKSVCADLAKKSDMSAHAVEKWFYMKRQESKPSTLVKFQESAWRMVAYSFVTAVAIKTLWGKEWMTRTLACFDNFPFHPIDDDVGRDG